MSDQITPTNGGKIRRFLTSYNYGNCQRCFYFRKKLLIEPVSNSLVCCGIFVAVKQKQDRLAQRPEVFAQQMGFICTFAREIWKIWGDSAFSRKDSLTDDFRFPQTASTFEEQDTFTRPTSNQVRYVEHQRPCIRCTLPREDRTIKMKNPASVSTCRASYIKFTA